MKALFSLGVVLFSVLFASSISFAEAVNYQKNKIADCN
jgi:hypothetical protein